MNFLCLLKHKYEIAFEFDEEQEDETSLSGRSYKTTLYYQCIRCPKYKIKVKTFHVYRQCPRCSGDRFHCEVMSEDDGGWCGQGDGWQTYHCIMCGWGTGSKTCMSEEDWARRVLKK